MLVSRSSSSLQTLCSLNDSSAKLQIIKFNTRGACVSIHISFTTMAGKTRRRRLPRLTLFWASCAKGDHHEDDCFDAVCGGVFAVIRSGACRRSRSLDHDLQAVPRE